MKHDFNNHGNKEPDRHMTSLKHQREERQGLLRNSMDTVFLSENKAKRYEGEL